MHSDWLETRFYISIETQNYYELLTYPVIMARAKIIYILMIKVNIVVFFNSIEL